MRRLQGNLDVINNASPELVSVIITTYKRTDTLARAIRSVLIQSYGGLELIVVDDNATKEMADIIDSIISEFNDDRIRVVHNPVNLGGALARNIGIDNAKGEYIAFLDDDDEYLPEKINKQVGLMNEGEKELALVYCWDKIIDIDGKAIYKHEGNSSGHCYYDGMIDCVASTSLWLCKKTALKEVGCFTDTPCKQDSYLIVKLLASGFTVDRVPEHLVLYHHDGGMRISTSNHKTRIIGEEKLRDLCRDNYRFLNYREQKNVEHAFACRLMPHYIGMKMYEEARKTIKLVIQKPLNRRSLSAFKSSFKILMSPK